MNERIKILRKALGLTQQEFADKIGLKANTIGVYEMGIRNPKTSTILMICRQFNVSEEWFRFGTGEIFLSAEQSLPISLTINERIREIRIHFKMSMEEFGEHLGVGKSSISSIENGKHSVSNQIFRSICREFNINKDWLRNGSGDMFLASDTQNASPINFKERIIGAVTIMDERSAEKVWKFIKENTFREDL